MPLHRSRNEYVWSTTLGTDDDPLPNVRVALLSIDVEQIDSPNIVLQPSNVVETMVIDELFMIDDSEGTNYTIEFTTGTTALAGVRSVVLYNPDLSIIILYQNYGQTYSIPPNTRLSITGRIYY